MFWRRKPENPERGTPTVNLEELAVMLNLGTIKASVEGSVLVARHDRFTTRVHVVKGINAESAGRSIRAAVVVKSELPTQVQDLFSGRQYEATAGFNRMATLGALTWEGSPVFVGSRLTILDGDDAWSDVHMPLLLLAVIGATESILGAIARSMSGEAGRGGRSAWTAAELSALAQELSPMCTCRANDLSFFAEFGAEAGHLELHANQAHPEFGAGLLALLTLPHHVPAGHEAHKACVKLNQLEMRAADLPPHFGAWCPGQSGHELAYISFLPNALHSSPNIARLATFWARERAAWAGGQLEELGFQIRDAVQVSRPLVLELDHVPDVIPLIRHVPSRRTFDWETFNPDDVKSPTDLPPCLVMGQLDESSFTRDANEWKASWRSRGSCTSRLEMSYNFRRRLYTLVQSWNGIDGGLGQYLAHAPLGQIVAKALYLRFPRTWDTEAKRLVEERYQVRYLPQPKGTTEFFGVPDGAARTVAFMTIARNLRPIRDWLMEVLKDTMPAYPVAADAQLLEQTINYIEGKADSWTTDPPRCFHQSLLDTGLLARGLPIREVAPDGSAAWTVRRPAYVIFVTVPFWGLADLLGLMSRVNGPVRPTSADPLRPEFLPVIIPAGLDTQVSTASWWDPERTTHCTVEFDGDVRAEATIESVGRLNQETVDHWLSCIERKSEKAVKEFEDILRRAGWGGS